MTDTTQSHRRHKPKSGLVGWFTTRRRGLLTIILILAAIVAAFVIGLQNVVARVGERKAADPAAADGKLRSSTIKPPCKKPRCSACKPRRQAGGDVERAHAVQGHLSNCRHQSLIVANGRLTVGLVGAPDQSRHRHQYQRQATNGRQRRRHRGCRRCIDDVSRAGAGLRHVQGARHRDLSVAGYSQISTLGSARSIGAAPCSRRRQGRGRAPR